METKQMWITAQLSADNFVEQVEAVIDANTNTVYIASHPKRTLQVGRDIFKTFDEAQTASMWYIDERLRHYRSIRNAIGNARETTPYKVGDWRDCMTSIKEAIAVTEVQFQLHEDSKAAGTEADEQARVYRRCLNSLTRAYNAALMLRARPAQSVYQLQHIQNKITA